jgi:sugar phosphate isomerase/epimerase
MIRIGLDTESMHLWFQNKRMNILQFIDYAHEIGCDGVMINLIKDYNLDPEWGTLENNDPAHLAQVKQRADSHGMYIELATKGIGYDHIEKIMKVADALGAEYIRTYIPITLFSPEDAKDGSQGKYDPNKVRYDFDPKVFDEAVVSLKACIPLCAKYRVKIALENHEYETSEELVDVVKKVNSPWIGLHFDFGNSMMVWEDPLKAAENMAPYTFTTHFKDHIVIPYPEDKFHYVVCGVPAGTGNIPLKEVTNTFLKHSFVDRITVEMCYPYCAQFKRSKGTGGVNEVGEGAFKVEKELYDPKVMKPLQYYYPQEVSADLLEELLVKQKEGARASVAYARALCDSYKE